MLRCITEKGVGNKFQPSFKIFILHALLINIYHLESYCEVMLLATEAFISFIILDLHAGCALYNNVSFKSKTT